MADKTGLLPPRDLLQRLDGIEAGLKRNRKAGLAGWLGLVPALGGLGGLYATADQAATAGGLRPVHKVLVSACMAAVVISLYLIGRSRFWRRESREPFRYTCSVKPFQALGQLARKEFSELSEWMVYDMSERLNERIGRLSFLDVAGPAGDGDTRAAQHDAGAGVGSHIDVTGQYLVRARDSHRVIELTPRVRIGDNRSAATLGHPVKFTITESSRHAPGAIETSGSEPGSDSHGEPPGGMAPGEYDKLIERVYFSVATQIYRQIREDVQGKIRLLPTRFLKATAYFYEAEDYAGSNTLDAYDEARKLFRQAMELYDPRLRPAPARRVYRLGLWLSQVRTTLTWPIRARLANFFPRLGLPEVMAARSEIGYANTLLYRRLLAGMQGHRINSMYEARPVARSAIDRLRSLPTDVPGQRRALFQAYVAAALSWWALDSTHEARKCLREARRVAPSSFDTDARYLYAAGLIESRLHSSVPALRHAVERDPRFEIAQFQLAIRSEMKWRRSPRLERPVAQMVYDEYGAVLNLNPGNVRAWGNIGYMRWLMGDLKGARLAFDRGREYKQIQRETNIGSLDYGLARTAAEEGKLVESYTYYLAAIAAQVTQGVSDARATSSQFYFFDYIGDAILERFRGYYKVVVANCDALKNGTALPERSVESDDGDGRPLEDGETANEQMTPQLCDSVGEELEFNWRAVYKVTFDKTMKWEMEMDDLHVRSLFMWDIANLLRKNRGPRSARALAASFDTRTGETMCSGRLRRCSSSRSRSISGRRTSAFC